MKLEDGGEEKKGGGGQGNLAKKMSSSLLCYFNLVDLSWEELGWLGESFFSLQPSGSYSALLEEPNLCVSSQMNCTQRNVRFKLWLILCIHQLMNLAN